MYATTSLESGTVWEDSMKHFMAGHPGPSPELLEAVFDRYCPPEYNGYLVERSADKRTESGESKPPRFDCFDAKGRFMFCVDTYFQIRDYSRTTGVTLHLVQ